MALEQYFTRQEVIKLSDLTIGQFHVFERLGIVTPLKLPTGKNGLVLYNWEQLLIAKTYSKLREEASLQSIKEALKYLKENEAKEIFKSKKLIVYNKRIFWVDTDEQFTQVIQVSGKQQGQLVMTFLVEDLLKEMIKCGKDCNIVDFAERIKHINQNLNAA